MNEVWLFQLYYFFEDVFNSIMIIYSRIWHILSTDWIAVENIFCPQFCCQGQVGPTLVEWGKLEIARWGFESGPLLSENQTIGLVYASS